MNYSYVFTNHWTMKREGEHHQWHLRDHLGVLVARDRYQHDLISRYDLVVSKKIEQ